jgi:hypothetical protein
MFQRPRSNKRNPVGDFGVYSNRNTPAGIPTNREDIENDSRYHINFLVGILGVMEFGDLTFLSKSSCFLKMHCDLQ